MLENQIQILIIDDDPVFNRILSRALEHRKYIVHSARTPDEGLGLARRHQPEMAVLDLNLNGQSGLALIKPLLETAPYCRILVLTGYASISTAVEAIKLGAHDYLAKPADVDSILQALDDCPTQLEDRAPAQPMSVDRLEWEHIQRVLTEQAGNISATARALKMHRRTLQRKLQKRPVKE